MTQKETYVTAKFPVKLLQLICYETIVFLKIWFKRRLFLLYLISTRLQSNLQWKNTVN